MDERDVDDEFELGKDMDEIEEEEEREGEADMGEFGRKTDAASYIGRRIEM